VQAAIFTRLGCVPRLQDPLHGSLDLIERILWEGLAGDRAVALEMLAGKRGQRSCVQVARTSDAGGLHTRAGRLLEGLQWAVCDNDGEGLDQAPVGVPRQARVASQRDQPLDALFA